MAEIGATNPEYQPMRVKWRPFVRPRSKNHPPGTHSPVYYTNGTFIVSRIADSTLVVIVFPSSLCAPYKGLPSINNIFMRTSFFLCFYFFHFHRTFLAGAYVNPGRFFSNSLFVHSVLCQITHSFLNRYQPNLCQHFSHACSTCHTIFI